ncbi:MAG: hypothetical protein K2N91_05675 [Muribaculaceae bacterium]|nr:hypothetical protein [Muribaculaceae bacterium]
MNTRGLLLATSAVASVFAINAQTTSLEEAQKAEQMRSHHIISMDHGSAQSTQEHTDSIIRIFYEDQFRHAQDARAPYFLMMSRGNNMAMGIGGKLQGNMYYDFDGTIKGSDFATSSIPVPFDAANPTRFQSDISQTSIFATVFGRSERFGNYIVDVEGKFVGPSNSFKLKKAYITVGKVTFGQHKSTFCDPSAIPSTVETLGPIGAVDDGRFLLRFIQPLKHQLSVAASIEMPHDNYSELQGFTESTSAAMPNFAAYLQYGKTDKHVRLAGIVKSMRYRDLASATNHSVTGYGLNLTTKYNILPALTFYGAANYGRGIGGMVNDLGNGSNDLLSYAATSDNAGKMYAPESFGWYAGLEYRFTPSVFSTVIFSQDRLYTKSGSDYAAGAYRYGMYAVANIFWDITPRFEIGAEFDWGRRVNVDGTADNAHRIGLSGSFSF